jgi:hypothetical protein
MQLFINNFSADLVAGIDVAATEIELTSAAELVGVGGGDYCLLTLAEVDLAGQEVAWEVVKVTAVAGDVLTIERGIEGTARSWPADAGLTGRVTADTLARLRDAAPSARLVPDGGAIGQVLTALADGLREWQTPATGDGASAIVGEAYPDAAPPAIGATFIYERAVFKAVGTAVPEQWVQLAGDADSQGCSVQAGNSRTTAVRRMTRLLVVTAYGAPGDALPVALFTLPAWQASPGAIELRVDPQVSGLTVNIDIDFGGGWTFVEFFVAPSPVYTVTRAGNVLSLAVTEGARVDLIVQVYQGELYVEMRAAAASKLASL